MDKIKYEKKLVKSLLNYIPPPDTHNSSGFPNLKSWGLSKEATELLETDPNAFLLGGIFDRGILAESAWENPYLLKQRLGHLDVKKIARMSETQLQQEVGGHKHGKSLHRFYKEIAKSILVAAKLLLEKYDGNAKNIWDDGDDAEVVVNRFLEFYGIGPKIAHMLAILLIKYYGVNLTGMDKLDIAVDRNVARVFLRTGLIPSQKGMKEYKIYKLKDAIIAKARELYPVFPGALDEPTYEIGKKYCTAEGAYCNNEKDPCPLNKICTKRKRDYQVY